MTEHNHNHDVELDISNEKSYALFDENGNEVLYRKMLEFYHQNLKNMLF